MVPTVRPATDSELELLGKIELDADLRYRDTPGEHLVSDVPAFTETVLREHYSAHGRLLVAEANGTVTGFVAWGYEGDQEWLGVDQISVLRSYGRQGIGEAMLLSVLKIADERQIPAVLNTERSIPWNGPWYQRFGFVEVDHQNWTKWMSVTARQQETHGISWTDRIWMLRPFNAKD